MEFRKTLESDIGDIMNIIKQAQDYFKDHGIDQWQNNYPNFETIKNDINNKNSYVLLNDNKIAATAVISFDGEKTYDTIEGRWLSNNKYAVVHRIAVDNNFKGQGLSSTILEHAEKMCLERSVHSIKIDTHKENIPMQKLLKKNNFKYCGIIYLEDKSERIAFEKIINTIF